MVNAARMLRGTFRPYRASTVAGYSFVNTQPATMDRRKEGASTSNCSKAEPMPSMGCTTNLKKGTERKPVTMDAMAPFSE